jgi:nucleoid-associated protein YgaU
MAVVVSLLVHVPSSAWCQQYLYLPTPVPAEGNAAPKDGVLVQDVSVQKGDTLYGISKRFNGRGSYYPQILLFNKISDPNLIYPGDVFRVPVTRKDHLAGTDKAAASENQGTPVQKPVTVAAPAALVTAESVGLENKKRLGKEKSAGPAKKHAAGEKRAGTTTKETAAGQNLFENAIKAYRQDDFKTALELFDKFLAESPGSPLAADASFYKAECYLKLSN